MSSFLIKTSQISKILFFLVTIALIAGLCLAFYLSRPEDNITLIAVGDTGTGNSSQIQVGKAVAKVCKESSCDAVVILGDVIYDRGVRSVNDSKFKTHFEDPYEEIEVPIYIALGNHDYLGCTECYLEYSNHSSKWKFPSFYYRQSFGEILDLFVLDTENLSEKEQAWLEK